jgi:hypothetical protein
MWSQLGRQRPAGGDEGEAQQTSSPSGGGLWSRLVQVAADVAQDLAQPNNEGDDDEYYEEDEGEGWDENLGLDSEETPVWEDPPVEQDQGPYYESIETHNEEEHYEQGGEQEEHAYDQGDEQQYEQPEESDPYYQQHPYSDYNDDEGVQGQGWDEEEVDFSMDEEQNSAPTQTIGEELLWVGNEHIAVAEEEQPTNDINAEDDWDLEDENLFDDDTNPSIPPENLDQQGEQQVLLANPEEKEETHAIESGGENAWGHDDSLLNFDADEQHPVHEADAPATYYTSRASADDHRLDESPANEWDRDEEPNKHAPNEEEVGVEPDPDLAQVSYESYGTANETEGDAWNDDDGLDLDAIEDEPHTANVSELPGQGSGDSFDSTTREGEGGHTLSESVYEISGEAASGHDEPQSAITLQVETGESGNNEWDMDDLNFGSHREGDNSVRLEQSGENTNGSEKPRNTVSFLVETDDNYQDTGITRDQGTMNVTRDDPIACGDDYRLCMHQETTAAPQLLSSGDAPVPKDEEWSDDELNFSEHHDDNDADEPCDGQDAIEPTKVVEPPVQETESKGEQEQPAEHGDPWGEDDRNFSEQLDDRTTEALVSQPDDTEEDAFNQDVDPSTSREAFGGGELLENAESNVFHASPAGKNDWNDEVDDDAIGLDTDVHISEDGWNESGFNLDGGEWSQHEEWMENQEKPRTDSVQALGHSDDGDDDSTVEQSNIGFEQSTEENRDGKQSAGEDASATEIKFVFPGRIPSRRTTLRASNTSTACISRKGSEDNDSEKISQTFVGTSVMFADLSLQQNNDFEGIAGRELSAGPTDLSTATGLTGQLLVGRPESEREAMSDVSGFQETTATSEVSGFRDTISSVSDTSADLPKPIFETQISMMTLKSIADSCPSRQRDHDSDEDDEVGYLPVVDKTPEGGAERNPIPELSTMTINSNAVAIHTGSVNDDIEKDDDMDGTYYGGSTTGEGQPNEDAWEEDEAISLGGLHDLSESIVNFELSAGAMGSSNTQPEANTVPLDCAVEHQVETSTPPMDSSMAMFYTDDVSVPSRDNDDDCEDNYRPVIDQIPRPLQDLVSAEKSGRTLHSLTGFSDIQDDGKDESATNEEGVRGEDHGWDDGFLGDIELNNDDSSESEGGENHDESEVVVDSTPAEANLAGWKCEGSLAAVESADNSCPSRVHDSDDEMYGRVVDQIPASTPPLLDQMSVTASTMAVVANNVAEDLKCDEELDASDHGDSTVDDLGGSGWDDDDLVIGSETKNEDKSQQSKPAGDAAGEGEEDVFDGDTFPFNDRVVDLTPKMEGKKVSRLSSNSLAVLAHSVNVNFEDEDESEDDANFGPIVDITPTPKNRFTALAPSLSAVQAATIRDDSKQDETTEDGVGDVNWDDECPELEGMESGEEDAEETASEVHGGKDKTETESGARQVVQNQVVVVDHTPEGETPRKLMGDASLAVLAPSEDGTVASINDDELTTTDPNGELMSYGPVVDITPTLRMQPIGAPSTAPSVTFSLAVEAHSVDQDFKLDDEMDETFCGDTTICETGGEGAWADDQTLDDLTIDASVTRSTPAQTYRSQAKKPYGINDGEQMVDHTPQLNSPAPRIGDASLVALAASEVGTYRSASDSAIDDDTITHEEALFGKMVDHTPRLAPLPLVSSNSMAVGASSADFRSEMDREEDMDATLGGDTFDAVAENEGWEDNEEALDEIDASAIPPLDHVVDEIEIVDHTPVSDGQRILVNADPSVRVLAPSDESSREEDNDTFDGNHAYGPVVDFTPHAGDSVAMLSESVVARHDGELEGTLYGDSTAGGDAGWDDDALDYLDEEKETESVVADPSNTNLWQPAELISDNTSSHLEGSTIGKSYSEMPSSRDGVVHLVDHTPSEIDSSAQKNSVAWLVNVESGISGDETDDAGASWRGSEQAAAPSVPTEEDQVVDRIPQGAQSRYGDASTLVVADPSDVLSHVGDLLQEDDFGPVVDLTPPSRPPALNAISAAASTAGVAPTVGPDDLDDADADDTVNAAEDNGWEGDPSEAEAPNPQSGNEEPTRVREQVVDFLPPQQEQAPDQNRDGWSEVTTGAEPSVLAADPKEDEFGRKRICREVVPCLRETWNLTSPLVSSACSCCRPTPCSTS